jgi:5-methylcytosine-specific restriction endonuclease McrBC regulatory subunit McrC
MIKKVLFSLTIFLVLNLNAMDSTEKELPSKMQTLLKNMESIQRAGLYNNMEELKKSIKTLKSNIKFAKDLHIKKFLPEYQKFATKFSEQRVKMIEMYADDMLESANNKKLDDALNDYSQILRQCTSCHIRLREW